MSRKKQKTSTNAPFYAPLFNLPYDEQLKLKSTIPTKVLDSLRTQLELKSKQTFYEIPSLTPEIVPIKHMTPSPSFAFRNKCEFTIGYTAAQGDEKQGHPDIGFCYRVKNSINVFPLPEDLPIVHPAMKSLVDKFKAAIFEQFQPYDRETKETGCLRLLSVRMAGEQAFSLMLQVSQSSEQLLEVLRGFFEADSNDSQSSAVVHSIYVQENKGLTDACNVAPFFVCGDEKGLPMKIRTNSNKELTFFVSPSSFFQTNTNACEMLYGLVAEWVVETADAAKEKIIFDLCCGVGTIGQFIAAEIGSDKAVSIYGIDIVVEAIEDAKRNAALNFKDSCVSLNFVAGPCEQKIDEVLKNCGGGEDKEIICVVDPPRAGLHPSVLRTIRDTPEIDQIVYVSCNYESLAKDLVTLTENLSDVANDPGVSKPFRIVKMQPVDMFPHTEHCEVVCKLTRK